MKKCFVIFPLCVISLFLISCSPFLMQKQNETHTNLPEWDRGDEWTVSVKFWPDRIVDDLSAKQSYEKETWHYKVQSGSDRSVKSVLLLNGQNHFLMQFDNTFNLLKIEKFTQFSRSPPWKLKTIHDNAVAGDAFFYRQYQSHRPIIWFHPSLSGSLQDGTKQRFNFSSGPHKTNDEWITQKTTKMRDKLKISLRDETRETRVTFHWPIGEKWWQRAEWFHQNRLIAVARRQ